MQMFKMVTVSVIAGSLVLLLAGPARAQTDDTALGQQMAKLAVLDGGDYVAARNVVTALGTDALPSLQALADGTADWRVAAAADACVGWIVHGDTYRAFEAIGTGITRANTVQYRKGDVAWDETLSPLLVEKLLWTEDDANVRGAAVDLLKRIHDPRSARPLAWALNHDADPMVQIMAAGALQRNDGAGAHDGLALALRESNDPGVRAAAAMALGWRKDAVGTPVLLDALAHDKAVDVRAASAKALGWIGEASADIALETALLGDPESAVRGQAASALGRLGTERARAALDHAASHDADSEVVRLSTAALAKF